MKTRLELLPSEEVQELYALPGFNSKERKLYFTLNELELGVANKYVNHDVFVYSILQIGYFKAKQQFFKFTFEDVQQDVEYILALYLKKVKPTLYGCVSQYYISKQKQEILSVCNYKDWSVKIEHSTVTYICELLRYYPKTRNTLRNLLNYFTENNIVLPKYRKLQDLFATAHSTEMDRLSKLAITIPDNIKIQLRTLIEKGDGISQLNIIRWLFMHDGTKSFLGYLTT